ncbi:MAG TPA: hypothetical protein VGH73_06930 [Thermoanaerobaculia bacterium]|jgi:hypothetical protein
MESAFMQLQPRTAESAVAAALAVAPPATITGDSALAPGTKTLYAPVSVTNWREVMAEYKQRKLVAPEPATTDAVPAAPMVPGGRNWLPLGPAVVLHGQTEGNQPVAGRVAALAIAPGGQVVYAASANGGVFRSDDGAASWKALMDGFDLDPTNYASDSLACGAIALDPATPQRVYVGTGEGDSNAIFGKRITGALPAYRGVGPIRTDDGGATWQSEASAPDLAGEAFFSLAIDPANRDNVLGATTAGLYQRLPAPGGSFQWIRQREKMHSAVVATSLGGATRFFAAQWGDGVYASADGQVWSPAGTGFPAGDAGRIALGVQANNPNLVYALVADTKGGLQGLYRLDNLAGSWQTVSDTPAVLAGSQGSYDLAIAVDPVDPSCIYLGGDRLNVSPGPASIWRCVVQATGAGFTVSGAASIGSAAHADVHSLLHTPGDPNELWCTCDGGVFLNRDPRGSGRFASQNTGLACLCSNFFSQHPTDPNVLFVGLQDNGTARTDGGSIWTHVNSGDGGYCLIHWANPDMVLVYANGIVYRSTNGGKSEDSWSPASGFPWATMTEPVVGTPYNPAQPADADLVALGAGRLVFISADFAATWKAGTVVLPNDAGNVFALKLASPERLFIGTTNGWVFRADLAAGKWTLSRLDDVAAAPLGLSGLISDIEVDWADATLGSIYVAFGGKGDRRRVWRFDGARWEARSGPAGGNNLLDIEHNAIVVDRAAPSNLYVAADLGVWQSADSGQNWTVMRDGLPEAAVFDLQIHPTQRLLRAATYGRGMYEIPLG